MRLEGGCFCGAVRYRIDGGPSRVTHCHCVHCRRLSGAAFVTWAEFRLDDMTCTSGKPKTLESRPGVTRSFCGDCGTPLTFRDAGDAPAVVDVIVCSLDEPEGLVPQDHVWCDRELPWIRIADGLARYPRGRAAGPEGGS